MTDDDKAAGAGDPPADAKPARPAAGKAAAAARKPEGKKPDEKTLPDGSTIYQRVAARVGDVLAEGSHIDRGDLVLAAKLDRVHDLCRFLRDDPELVFDYLCQLTAVDYPDRAKRFTVVWTLIATTKSHLVHVVTEIGEEEEVPTVTDLWATANWHEREAFDMFGVRFRGHPDLRRILLPDWWEGHPLRKDYPLEGRGEHELVVEECLRPRG